jgi:diguanylate cyclase (GGDEF)-like protein/PAS domain S-box-containing protein
MSLSMEGRLGSDERWMPRLHEQVFQALSEAVIVTDLSGRVVDCNRAAEEMFASERVAMLGLTPDEIRAAHKGAAPTGGVPAEPVRRPAPRADILQALAEHGSWSGDVPVPGTVGGIGAARVFPVKDEDGELVGFAGIFRDVTAERATATELERAEERWRTMLEVAPTGLALVTLEGRFDRVNKALCRIVGYPPEELLRMTFQQITHPDDLVDDLSLIHRLLAGEIERYTLEKRYKHALGHSVWVQLSVTLIRNRDTGQPEQFVAAIENITGHRQSLDRLHAIIAGANDAFIGIAPAGYVTEWNAAAEKLFGYTRTEAFGHALTELIIPPGLRDAHQQGLERLRGGEAPRILGQPVALQARARDGRAIPVELTIWRADGARGTSLEGVDGEFYAFVRDVTERTRAVQQQSAIAAAQLAIAEVELSPEKVMHEICTHAQALTGAEGACVETIDGNDLVYRAGTGANEQHQGVRLPIGSSLSGLAVTTAETLWSNDTHTDPRVHAVTVQQTGDRSIVVVPLRGGDQIHGVLKIHSRRPGDFTEQDCATLNLLAAPFGAALANARQLEATATQAATDALTGLGNRGHGLSALDRALLRQGRQGGLISVMFIDLDHFKPVNDVHGHHAGDQVLQAVAGKLRSTVRRTDTCARYGGDEFLIVSEDISSRDGTIVFAERLIHLIAGPYPLQDEPGTASLPPVIGASIGIAVSAAPVPAAQLLQAADEAMYEAKNSGGNTYAIRDL